MTTKGRPVAELSDGKWVWQLAFLAGVTQHLNDFNLRLQGKAKLVNEMFYDVKSSDAKLSLFEKQLSTGNLAHFKLRKIVKNDESVTIPFPESWAKISGGPRGGASGANAPDLVDSAPAPASGLAPGS